MRRPQITVHDLKVQHQISDSHKIIGSHSIIMSTFLAHKHKFRLNDPCLRDYLIFNETNISLSAECIISPKCDC